MENSEVNHIIFYGSLMRGMRGRRKIDVENDLEYIKDCKVSGALFDLGEYPGLLPEGNGIVKGELFKIVSNDIIERLDEFEGHNVDDPSVSLFRREALHLKSEDLHAYIYYYNKEVVDAFEIRGGDWKTHAYGNR